VSQQLLYGDLRRDGSRGCLGDSLAKLRSYLHRPPVRVQLQLEAISSADLETIGKIRDGRSLPELTSSIVDLLCEKYGYGRSILLCHREHFFAKLALRDAPHALWGARNGWVAYVYGTSHDEAVWHEVLHLLGAEDCYDTSDPAQNPGPTCDLDDCIMQYAPTPANIRDWPFVCAGNIRRIRAPG